MDHLPSQEPPEKPRVNKLGTFIVYFFMSFVLTVAVLLLSGEPTAYAGYFNDQTILFLNWLPVVALGFMLLGLIGRYNVAFFLWAFSSLSFGAIAGLKMMLRQEGLKPLDFTLIRTVFLILPDYLHTFPRWGYVAMVVTIVGLFFFSRLFKGRLSGKKRFAAFFLPLLIMMLALSSFGPYQKTAIYLSHPANSPYDFYLEDEAYLAHGAPYGFLYFLQYSFHKNPADDAAAERLLAKYEPQPMGKVKPHILVYQLESFKDFYTDSDAFVLNPYKKWQALEKESIAKGHLTTVVYGGGTVTTETGVIAMSKNTAHFNRPRHTFATYLGEKGYQTAGFHPNHGTFYNRITLFRNEGFDDFYYMENYFHNEEDGYHMPDSRLLQAVETRFKEAEAPYFAFTIGIENHAPYKTADREDASWIRYPQGVDKTDINTANHFLDGMADSSQAVYDFTRRMKTWEEPFICVFYGDHSPQMSDGSYLALGYPNRQELAPEAQLQLTYGTPFIFWANDAAKKAYGLKNQPPIDYGDNDVCFLLPLFAKTFDLGGDSRMMYLEEMQKIIPVVREDLYLQEGTYTNALTEKNRNHLSDLRNLEWYYKKVAYQKPKDD